MEELLKARTRVRDTKKTLDNEETKRKRDDASVQLRRVQREEQLCKRRQKERGVPVLNSTATVEDRQAFELEESKFDSKGLETKMRLQILAQWVAAVNSEDGMKQKEGTLGIRKLASLERKPPLKEIIETNVVPRLIQFCASKDEELVFDATWALTNIASGDHKCSVYMVKNGGLRAFHYLMKHSNADIREQAIWGVGNIAGDCVDYRNLVLKEGVLEPLLLNCRADSKLSMIRNATWALCNLCRGSPLEDFSIIAPALPILGQLLKTNDDEIITDSCYALSELTNDPTEDNKRIGAVMSCNIGPRAVELLTHKNVNIKTRAIRLVGNIMSAQAKHVRVLLEANVLPCLLACLACPAKVVRKEACWAVSNIAADENEDHIEALIKSNIMPAIIQIIHHAEPDIKKEAMYALGNAITSGTNTQVVWFVAQQSIPAITEMLKHMDAGIIHVGLKAAKDILRTCREESQKQGNYSTNKFADMIEECGALDVIEKLQEHDNEEVYDEAIDLLKCYFDPGDDEESKATEEKLGPKVNGDAFAFGTASSSTATNTQFDFGASAFPGPSLGSAFPGPSAFPSASSSFPTASPFQLAFSSDPSSQMKMMMETKESKHPAEGFMRVGTPTPTPSPMSGSPFDPFASNSFSTGGPKPVFGNSNPFGTTFDFNNMS